MAKRSKTRMNKVAKAYEHHEKGLLRPEVGLQNEFKQRKPPALFRFDPSLSPELGWDMNPARERAEALIRKIRDTPNVEEARTTATELARISNAFLNWAGKAERRDVEVSTLPLFVHERLSTKAILESLRGHKPQQTLDLFGDSGLDIADRILKAYEHKSPWTNRLILGDSLVVMNSLLQYEGLGEQVQMIYMDPPYGVKFGSNFQPFVRKREAKHGDDEFLTREPEMVQAYRDTWELGIHSYLTYLRDRLRLCRELLHPSGSVFVQISDENLHHVRELLDEIFGSDNFVSMITFRKTSGAGSISGKTKTLASVADYLLWYAKDIEQVKYNQLYLSKEFGEEGASQYQWLELGDGTRRRMTAEEKQDPALWPKGARPFGSDNLISSTGVDKTRYSVDFEGRTYRPHPGVWKTGEEGMQRLRSAKRLIASGDGLYYVRYLDDFKYRPLSNLWDDTISSFMADKVYVVQTLAKVVQRCMLMTTTPGDLVLDPTCGGGTSAYVAEHWGRRWITIDTSRVPLALTRQRLLTSTFPYYRLKQESQGPAGGFVYERGRSGKGTETGGIAQRITLRSIARDELPEEVILVDRPNIDRDIVRVTGPFTVEAVLPLSTQALVEQPSETAIDSQSLGDTIERVVGALQQAGNIRLPGGRLVQLQHVRVPAHALDIHAEAETNGGELLQRVAVAVGPPDGPVSETLVYRAAKEANAKGYAHLYVIGFAVEDAATKLISNADVTLGIPVSYVNAALDILMGDGGWNLLKTTRASEVFSITGSPDVLVTRFRHGDEELYQVHLRGVDIFDPVEMEVHHKSGEDVPAWFLDSDYNELAFWVSQAFFPRTGAWDNLRRELRGLYREEVWDHLAGTTSAPFPAGKHSRVAVKAIDDRGNELVVVKDLKEAESV